MEAPPEDNDIWEVRGQLKKGKAAGLDSTLPEMLTYAPCTIKLESANIIILKAWFSIIVPKEWKDT